SMAVTGPGASRAAAATTASGTREDGGTDFGPVGGALERAGMLGREQNLAAAGGHRGMPEHLGKVVDENLTIELADAAHLGVAAVLEEHAARVEAEAVLIEKTLSAHPAERARAQIGAQRIVMGEHGLVAHHVDLPSVAFAAAPE